MGRITIYGQIKGFSLTEVSSTTMLTLYCRAMESRSANPLLIDPKAEEIVARINDDLLNSENVFFRRLGRFRLQKQMVVFAALRARKCDSYVVEFLQSHPDCLIVNLGCGLDTRFWRIDNGRLRFFDLDLPEVIDLKRSLVEETDRYTLLECSVLDYTWMDMVLTSDRPVMILAEGLLMYLPQHKVQMLLTEMAEQITAGQLVAEMAHKKYTEGFNSWLLGLKFKYGLGFGRTVKYRSGIADSYEIASWSSRLHLLDDWCYFDEETPKLGWMRLFRHIEGFRKAQWIVRYRIGT